MTDDHALRIAAFREVRRLADVNGDLTSRDLRAGFRFDEGRIPLIDPQRGIFKPTHVHRQIYEGDEAVDYAFMGQDADAAENRWLREAMENPVPSFTSSVSRREFIAR